MSSSARGRRRRHSDGGHDSEERWLLTYADMITLLLALFVVLFSISSVNISKLQTLQEALRDAFSGKVLSGGQAILQTSNDAAVRSVQSGAPVSIVPSTPTVGRPATASGRAALAARREQDELLQLKRMLDAFAAKHGFASNVQTVVARRGLIVRLLTDRVLFDSGLASLKSQGLPLLDEVGTLLNVDRTHAILVEGHTDDVPISTSAYASNWELSTARATQVVRYLIARNVAEQRFGAAGYADLHPIASNATAAGRGALERGQIDVGGHAGPPGYWTATSGISTSVTFTSVCARMPARISCLTFSRPLGVISSSPFWSVTTPVTTSRIAASCGSVPKPSGGAAAPSPPPPVDCPGASTSAMSSFA